MTNRKICLHSRNSKFKYFGWVVYIDDILDIFEDTVSKGAVVIHRDEFGGDTRLLVRESVKEIEDMINQIYDEEGNW